MYNNCSWIKPYVSTSTLIFVSPREKPPTHWSLIIGDESLAAKFPPLYVEISIPFVKKEKKRKELQCIEMEIYLYRFRDCGQVGAQGRSPSHSRGPSVPRSLYNYANQDPSSNSVSVPRRDHSPLFLKKPSSWQLPSNSLGNLSSLRYLQKDRTTYFLGFPSPACNVLQASAIHSGMARPDGVS